MHLSNIQYAHTHTVLLPPTDEVEMFLGLVEVKAHPCRHGRRLQPVGAVDSLSFDGQLSDVLVEQFTLRGGEGEEIGGGRRGEGSG